MFLLCSHIMLRASGQPSGVQFEPRGPINLFFSVFPDSQAAARIGRLARHLRREHGLNGLPFSPARFHCTLCGVDDRNAPWQSIVAKVREAAATIEAAPFRVSFNGVMSFSSKEHKCPLVLVGDEGVIGLMMLYSSLRNAMHKTGLRPETSNFTPHVTMLYDARRIGEQSVEPISWAVNEIVLVLSFTGQTKYHWLGRWQLRGSSLDRRGNPVCDLPLLDANDFIQAPGRSSESRGRGT
jgi:RNA 2',3'-cyclic 3'-phosphodiesterase